MITQEQALEAIKEREVMIKAFDEIRKCFNGRTWLMEGSGCYAWDDDEYKMEVKYLMDEFDAIEKNVWKNIKSKTFEARQIIESHT